jgi:hypothetical protein
MLGGRKITVTLTGETLERSVAKCCLQRGILLTDSCEAWLQTNSKRDSGMAVIQWRMHYSNWGHAVAQLVEVLRYKPEGRGFDP